MKDLSNRTAVIVLNWNKPEMTLECLDSLQTMEGKYDVFIVDNGSDKDKRDKLIEKLKNKKTIIIKEENLKDFEFDLELTNEQIIFLILLNKNYGYAKGNNYGLKLSHKLGYKYSLISNNDVKITNKNVLTEMEKEINSNEKYAWVGPKIIGSGGKEQGPGCRISLLTYSLESGIFYPFLYKRRKKRIQDCRNGVLESSWPVGCFILFKNKAMADVSFFEEKTFLYSEEPILAEKFIEKSYKFKYISSICVFHAHAQTTNSLFRNEYRRFRTMIKTEIFVYFKEYRNYNIIFCFLAEISLLFFFFIYKPIIKIIKIIKNIS